MAINTVAELVEELEGFGGHVPVKVGLTTDPDESTGECRPLVIDERTLDGELTILIQPEV